MQNTRIAALMTADQVLALAEDLRSFARQLGRDLNSSNLFVHTMLTRALLDETIEAPDYELDHEEDEPRAA